MPNTRKAPEGALLRKATPGDEDDVEGHSGHNRKGPEGAAPTQPDGVNHRKATPGDEDDVEGHTFNRRGKGE